VRTLLVSAALMFAAPLAHAQHEDFPSKPIRILVPFNAGSGSDETSRVYGEMVSKILGQPVVIENRPGGSGMLAIQAVKSAPPDGYSIMLGSNSPMAVNPVVMKDLPYDPFKDFRPVHGILVGPAAFVVRAESPYKTMNDLVEAARKENRPIAVGNYSAGYQLIGAWLGTVTGVPITHVPYKGGAQMVTDIMGGQIETGVNDLGGVTPLLQSGKLRALGITGDKRVPIFPDVPTMMESGFADFETYVWAAMYVRSETPDAVVKKLSDAFHEALSSEQGKAYQATRPTSPLLLQADEMSKFHRREYERFKRVAEAAGIQPQ
jgi:tripartite-type tricarboxylate transporter receptor subunit TctC